MSTDHKHAGTFYPHQMSKDEFASWWNQVNEQSKETLDKPQDYLSTRHC